MNFNKHDVKNTFMCSQPNSTNMSINNANVCATKLHIQCACHYNGSFASFIKSALYYIVPTPLIRCVKYVHAAIFIYFILSNHFIRSFLNNIISHLCYISLLIFTLSMINRDVLFFEMEEVLGRRGLRNLTVHFENEKITPDL